MNIFKDKSFVIFLLKFLLLFAAFYFGTLLVIGLAAPGGRYIPFVAKYMDYVSWIKQSIIFMVGLFSGWVGYETVVQPDFIIRVVNGAGVKVAMSCVGYGVYSFWASYIIANEGSLKKKLYWALGGLLFLWLINCIRITLVLIAVHERKPMPFGIDHHDWFNIVAYAAIFCMIALFEKKRPAKQ